MAADANLIKGAQFAATGGSPTGGYIDPAEYIEKGLKEFTDRIEAGQKNISENLKELQKENEKDTVNSSGLGHGQINIAEDWINKKKSERNDIDSQMSKIPNKGSSEYRELAKKRNQVNRAIFNFGEEKDDFLENKQAYADINIDEISLTNSNKDLVDDSVLIYGNDGPFKVSENGEIIVNNSKGEEISFRDVNVGKLKKKAKAQANSIISIDTQATKYASKGQEPNLKIITNEVGSILTDFETARSVMQDKVLFGEIYALSKDFTPVDTDGDKNIDNEEYLEQARKFLADSIYNLAVSEYEQYKPNLENTRSRKSEPMTELQKQLISVVETQIKNNRPIIIKDRIKLQPSDNGYQVLEYDKDTNKWRSTNRLVEHNDALNFWMQYKF
jgi:hypothetical protein